MNRRHFRPGRWLGPLALSLAFVLLLLAPAHGAGLNPPFMEDTHVLRRILSDMKLKPLNSFKQLSEIPPQDTLLIVLGRLECLERRPGGVDYLQAFLRKGGAVLLASDQSQTPEAVQGALRRIAGVNLKRRSFNWEQSPGVFFRGLIECPFLVPVPGEDPNLFFSPGQRESLHVATNIPAELVRRGRLPLRIHPLANLPAEALSVEIDPSDPRDTIILQRSEPLLAVGGRVGEGRLLLLADHSIFINEMLLPTDNDNIEFTYRCLEWLRPSPAGKRSRALVVLDGTIQSDFNPILKELPVTPPEQAVVQAVNEQVAQLEDHDTLNRVVLGWMEDTLGRDDDRLARWLVYGVVLALVLYGVYRFCFGVRPQTEPALTPLDESIASQTPEDPLVERRQRALLRGGNLWESAHVLARQCFAGAGVPAPEPGVPGSCPRVRSQGSWWQRFCMAGKVHRLWRLAHDPRPVHVSPRRLRRLLGELRDLRSALDSGVVRLE